LEMTRGMTEYLLRHYPTLFQQVRERAADAVEGGNHGDLSRINRRPQGGHSDPTARKALALLEAGDLAAQLSLIREWIDTLLAPEDRPVLLAVWRQGFLGWERAAREVGLEAVECQRRWSGMVTQLTGWLTFAR